MRQTVEEIRAEEKNRSAPLYQKYLNAITTIDDYWFEYLPWFKHVPEPPSEELRRLKYNQSNYREMIKCGHRFPAHINKARLAEHLRIKKLRGYENEMV